MNIIIQEKNCYWKICLNGEYGNIGLISKEKRESNGQTVCYFNINNKGMNSDLKPIFLQHQLRQVQQPGPAKGVGTGKGYVGYIEFGDKKSVIDWLENSGFTIKHVAKNTDKSKGGKSVNAIAKNIKIKIDFWSWIPDPTPNRSADFNGFYENLIKKSNNLNCYHLIDGQIGGDINRHWPKNFGVYVVRKKPVNLTACNEIGEILYVGMTGRIDQKGNLTGPGLEGRKNRITPYCFTKEGKYQDHFEYSPVYTDSDKLKNLPLQGRYKKRCPFREICIDCFIVDRNGTAAPAFLEALILQIYLMCKNKLPEANNSF
jgi:hypothetical protein